MKIFLWSLLLTSVAPFCQAALTKTLTVKVNHIRSDKGSVIYSLFNSHEGYPSKGELSLKSGNAAIKDGQAIISFNDLPPGDYAVVLFHDEDSNSKLDTNFLGIPKEGYGFSNDARVTFGPPSYEKVKFTVSNDGEISIKMRYW